MFNASNYTSDQGHVEFESSSYADNTYYLFNIMLFRTKKYGMTNINVHSNSFYFVGSGSSTVCNVHLLFNRALISSYAAIATEGLGLTNPQGDKCFIRDNFCVGSGSLGVVLNRETVNSGGVGNWGVTAMTYKNELADLEARVYALEHPTT